MSKVGRPLKPLDPKGGALPALAQELREMRHRSGLTLQQVAKAASYSTTTCAEACRGKRLPTREVASAIARVCDGDEERVGRLWEQAAQSVGREVISQTQPDPPDPSTASTPQEFLDRMKQLRKWARLSLRDLSNQAEGHRALPPSTVHDALNRGRLPTAAFVSAYVKACNLSDDQTQQWLSVRNELNANEADKFPSTGPVRQPLPDPRLLARWLRGLAGIHEDILDHAAAERGRYTRRGVLVLLTSALAGFGISLSAASLLGTALAVATGVVWTLMELYFSSSIASNLHTRRGRKRHSMALAYGLPVLLTGMMLAEPLVLEAFQRSIEERIHTDRATASERFSSQLAGCNSVDPRPRGLDCAGYQLTLSAADTIDRNTLRSLSSEMKTLDERGETNRLRLEYLQNIAIKECTGIRGSGLTGVVGDGPSCALRRKDTDDFYRSTVKPDEAALKRMVRQHTRLGTRVRAALAEAIDKRTAEFIAEISKPPGTLDRMDTLSLLARESPIVMVTTWLMLLGLALVPLTPLLLAYLDRQTLYQRLLIEEQERRSEKFQQQLAEKAAQELQELQVLTEAISELMRRLPSPEEHPGIFRDIATFINTLTEVRARLITITEPSTSATGFGERTAAATTVPSRTPPTTRS
ncbi:DUF4407 domain-containing protein [Nonomuraea bangladeshensis]